MPDLDQSESHDLIWELHLTLTPTSDGKFARINIRMDRPQSRIPLYVNSAGSTDLLYEKVQGELNNTLRQLVNDIHQVVVKPQQLKRR